MLFSEMLRRVAFVSFLRSVLQLLVTAIVVPNSPILVTLIMEVIHFLRNVGSFQEQCGITSQKTAFFIATVLKPSNLTSKTTFNNMPPYSVGFSSDLLLYPEDGPDILLQHFGLNLNCYS
jgi:hypothetical protein